MVLKEDTAIKNGRVKDYIMNILRVNDLKDFTRKALLKAGMTAEDAATVSEVLVTTDTFGVFSHGTNNVLNYILKMQAGGLNPKAVPTVEEEGPAWAVVNGNHGMGMVTSCMAMNLAMEKAKACGIGYVTVKHSCHFGAAGYYSNMAAAKGMIGIAMSNGDPIMAVPNSSNVAIGNNPFSYAAPWKNGRSVFLDIALSNVAALKVVMARDKGETVPPGWLVDSDGMPTNDPSGFPYTSFLLPMAAHKGYGFAIMVEILSSIISGSGILSEVKSWNRELATPNDVGHAFIAIDIEKMISREAYERRMEQMITELQNVPKAKNATRIFVPGEIEWEKREKVLSTGKIAVTEAMVNNLSELSKMTEISLEWLDE